MRIVPRVFLNSALLFSLIACGSDGEGASGDGVMDGQSPTGQATGGTGASEGAAASVSSTTGSAGTSGVPSSDTMASDTMASDSSAGGAGGAAATDPEPPASSDEPFSFFVTSLEIMRELSGSEDGFGGDLGGLAGADDICQQAATAVGFGGKTWRAFLSATDGGDGQPVHASERIGEGPWYDRNGLLIAENIQGLLGDRPDGDPATVNDLPNEFGEGLEAMGDTHDVMTGTNAMGQLDSTDPANTCNDWTSTTVTPVGGGRSGGGGLRLGHAWPAERSGTNWMAVHSASSCGAGVNLVQNGAGDGSSVGAGGGWGAIYCFALSP